MRLNWPPPWDIIASALISILALFFVLLSPSSIQTFITFFILFFVILLPGYLFVLSLFPTRNVLNGRGRIMLSLGMSLAIVFASSLILAYTPRGFNPASLAVLLCFLTLFLALVAYLRWSAVPRRKSFGLWSRRGLRSTRSKSLASLIVLPILLAMAFVLAAFAFNINANQGLSAEKDFTEFNVSWPEGIAKEKFASVEAGSAGIALADVVNHEHRYVNYTLQLDLNNTTLFIKDIKLGHNQSWRGPVGYVLNSPLGLQKMVFLLFKDDDFNSPYREDYLWINVSENKSGNFSGYEISENRSSAILEKKSKIIVLGLSEGYPANSDSTAGNNNYESADKELEPVVDSKEKDSVELSNDQDPSSIYKQISSSDQSSDGSQISEQQSSISETMNEPSGNKESVEVASSVRTLNSIGGLDVKSLNEVQKTKSGVEPQKENSETTLPLKVEKPVESTVSAERVSASSKEAAKTSELRHEINSLIDSRSSTSSEKSQKSFESKNIRYVKGANGERAVLGRTGTAQSQKPIKLG